MRSSCLLYIRFDEIAVLRYVLRTRFETTQHFRPITLRFTEFEHANFIGVLDTLKDDRKVSERLQGRCFHCERHSSGGDLRLCCDECAGQKLSRGILESCARDDGLIVCRLQLEAFDLSGGACGAICRLDLHRRTDSNPAAITEL